MNTEHFELMGLALRAESQSEHPTHKVGALIHGTDSNESVYKIARSNFWPSPLKKHIGHNKKLGNASTTVHAEIATICAAPSTENANIYVTNFPCPNCAKIIAEARIKSVYIDAHTHNTPLGLKMKPYFDDVSTRILKSANISVYEINSTEKTVRQIITPPPNVLINIEHPIEIMPLEPTDINQGRFANIIKKHNENIPFAACFAKSLLGHYSFLSARPHRSIGLLQNQMDDIMAIQNKYEPSLQPLNRLLLTCARYGLNIDPDYLYSSQTPTSREFVNMIGAGYSAIRIGDKTKCRDKHGLKALSQLEKHNIMHLQN